MRASLKLVTCVAAISMAGALGFSAAAVAAGSDDRPPTEQDRGRVSPMAVTPNPEMLYVAITPCRIVDTRDGGGRLSANQTRSFFVTGATGFDGQGGQSTGCGIPAAAQAVSASLTAVEPTKAGALRAWPAGQSEPTATVLSYAATKTGTGATLSIRSGTAKALTVKNYQGRIHLVVDVFGYYVPQLQAYIGSGGGILDQSGRLVSSTRTAVGNYTLVWDRDVTSCSGQGSSDLTGHITSVYTNGTVSYVYVVDNAGNPSDYWTNVLINC